MAKLRAWCVADSESNPFDGESEIVPFIWAVRLKNKTIIFEDDSPEVATRMFLEWLCKFDGLCYAHNGGKFDWMFKQVLSCINDDTPIMLINGRIAKAKIGKCEIRDSFLCLPVAQAQLEKNKFDYSILTEDKRAANMPEIREYLESDVVGLYNSMERFIEHHGQALTQAGAALKAWEKMGGSPRRGNPTHDEKFRRFYFGGRVEVFKYCNGEKVKRKMMDVVSAYPYAMTFDHPLGSVYFSTTDLKKVVGGSFWTIRAISRGALPVRTKDGSVDFPNLKKPRVFRTTGWEILAGLETGTLEIFSGKGLIPAEFETLKPYVDKFMKDKDRAQKEGDQIGRQIAKIFLNSLYGKFAANPETYKMFRIGGYHNPHDPDDPWNFYQLIQTDIGTRPIYWTPSPTGQFYDVALAASITGHARANLWRHICKSKNPVYCDTDSILCEEAEGFDFGDHLGQWENESATKNDPNGYVSQAWIAGKKLYAFLKSDGKYKIASKGVRATAAEIKRAARGDVVKIKRLAPNMKIDGRQIYTDRHIRITGGEVEESRKIK